MQIIKKQEGENSIYWEKANEISREVNEWPAWKKSVHIGSGDCMVMREDRTSDKEKSSK